MWDWIGKYIANLILLVSIIFTNLVMLYQIRKNALVQMKQNRPKLDHHECRVCWLGIYTYFDENNKLTEPACAYLSPDSSNTCMYNPEIHENPTHKKLAEEVLKINNGKCYLSLWGSKQDKTQ